MALFDKICNFIGNVFNGSPGREATNLIQAGWFLSAGALCGRQVRESSLVHTVQCFQNVSMGGVKCVRRIIESTVELFNI
eukprot:1157199-Pelagomonas_calceolata.AAC.1